MAELRINNDSVVHTIPATLLGAIRFGKQGTPLVAVTITRDDQEILAQRMLAEIAERREKAKAAKAAKEGNG